MHLPPPTSSFWKTTMVDRVRRLLLVAWRRCHGLSGDPIHVSAVHASRTTSDRQRSRPKQCTDCREGGCPLLQFLRGVLVGPVCATAASICAHRNSTPYRSSRSRLHRTSRPFRAAVAASTAPAPRRSWAAPSASTHGHDSPVGNWPATAGSPQPARRTPAACVVDAA